MLRITNLRAGYGAMTVLREVSLEVGLGECVGVLGANGAGKSTLLRAVSGFATVTGGELAVAGRSIRHRKPHQRARDGVLHVAEGRRLFPAMSVEENLRVAFDARVDRSSKQDWQRLVGETVYGLFPRLHERRHQAARSLSGGEQQMLAIGRALVLEPRVLMLDEPSTGLAPIVVDHIFDVLRDMVAHARMAVLVVEQRVDVLVGIVDRAYVLRSGELVARGGLAELRSSGALDAAFLGTGAPA
ncbi:ABC transporter ATP-binding protein [Actinophytocola sp.]|uniref:ABC transporter ATP-binding protein n=1 Tax=Actinophytocola sp. TaxID=1872138 RepID=UPI003D6A1709